MQVLKAQNPHHYHPHHYHHHHLRHLLLAFMGSGTGANSGSGSSSSSNSPPPVIKSEPHDQPEEAKDPAAPGRPSQSSTSSGQHSPPVGLLNHRHLVGDEKLVVATLASLEHSGDPSHLIKQDLRLIIQSRRKAEGKGELHVDFQEPPKDELTDEEWEKVQKRRDQNRIAAQRFRQKRRRISSSLSEQLTREELEKRARRRELNRLAAKRSREKCQRRKDTLIQEIQGMQDRNDALEGALGTLVEERDSLVQTLKGHLPRCQDTAAMSRSAQLLAFSKRLALLLDWALPASTSPPARDPQAHPHSTGRQPAPPAWPPPLLAHTPLPVQQGMKVERDTSTPSPGEVRPPGGAAAPFPDPAILAHHLPTEHPGPSPLPYRHHAAGGSSLLRQSHTRGSGHAEPTGSRELEIDATAAAAFREEIERRQHLLKYRVTVPRSPSSPPTPTHTSLSAPLSHPFRMSPDDSCPPHPSSLSSTPTLPFPRPHQSLPLHRMASSPSTPLHPLSPGLSFPPQRTTPSHPYPPGLGLHSPSVPVMSYLSSPGHSQSQPSSPSGDSQSQPSVCVEAESSKRLGPPSPPLSYLPSSASSQSSVKRPQTLNLRSSGVIPKKDLALRSPLIPKKNPALRSPVTPKKNPALRSPVHPKKDPALRSPILELDPTPTPVMAAMPTTSLPSSSTVFKRGPVQRMASFHGLDAHSGAEQLAPLNLSKRRKSEDLGPSTLWGGSDMGEEQLTYPGDGGQLSGLHTWPPPGMGGHWRKEGERPGYGPGRDRPPATITSRQLQEEEDQDAHTSWNPSDRAGFKTRTL